MVDSREDILISRIVGGDAGDREWDELAAIASDDADVWRRLAESHRDEAAVGLVVRGVEQVADRVGIDVTVSEANRPVIHTHPSRTAWAGWAVAAIIALAWTTGLWSPKTELHTATRPENTASLVPPLTSQEAFNQYMEKGREDGSVLSDTPRRVLLQTRPADGGQGYEVIFVQQILQKVVVPDLYRVGGQDERGQPALLRLEQPVRGRL